MSNCKVIQVISTSLLRRGKGVENSVLRCIQQYYSLEGELLFEIDPAPEPPECNCYDGPDGPHYPIDLPEGCAKRGLPCKRVALFEFRNLEKGHVYHACANHAVVMPIIGADK